MLRYKKGSGMKKVVLQSRFILPKRKSATTLDGQCTTDQVIRNKSQSALAIDIPFAEVIEL